MINTAKSVPGLRALMRRAERGEQEPTIVVEEIEGDPGPRIIYMGARPNEDGSTPRGYKRELEYAKVPTKNGDGSREQVVYHHFKRIGEMYSEED
jgi:hypothetical protein